MVIKGLEKVVKYGPYQQIDRKLLTPFLKLSVFWLTY